jgi:hypothetical protein
MLNGGDLFRILKDVQHQGFNDTNYTSGYYFMAMWIENL